MVGRPTRITVACAVTAATLLTGVGAADAHPRPATHVVKPGPGTPIQKAVDRARPGDTILIRPGHYRENVLVTKSLTIKGSGWGKKGTLLTPPRRPGDACEGESGICVMGKTNSEGEVTKRVAHVTIKNLKVRGFEASGVLGVATKHLRVERVKAVKNEEYGIASFQGTHTVLAHNIARKSEEAGVYLGDSPNARAWVAHNKTSANGNGVFVRDSTHVTAERNTAKGNCFGILLLNTGSGATAGGHYLVRDNTANDNTRACPGDEEEGTPPTSGAGIAVAGTHGVVVTHNTVLRNRPTGPSIASGGITVFSTEVIGGDDPMNNRITHNTVLRNRPADLVWDETGRGNKFRDNHNRTSRPAGLD